MIPSDFPAWFLLTLFLEVCPESRYRRLPLSAGFDPWLIKAQLMLARNDEDSYKVSLSSLLFLSLCLFSPLSHLISMRGNQSHLKIPGDILATAGVVFSLLSTGNVATSRIFCRTRTKTRCRVASREERRRREAGDLCRAPAAKRGVGRRPLRKALEVIEARCSDDISSPPRCRRPILLRTPRPKYDRYYPESRESEERLRALPSRCCVVVCNKCWGCMWECVSVSMYVCARLLASSQEYRIACRTRGSSSYGITWFRESHYRQIDCGYKILEVEMESI